MIKIQTDPNIHWTDEKIKYKIIRSFVSFLTHKLMYVEGRALP